VAAIAAALGDLRERVVFIGGAIAPLLQTHPPFARARLTSDVDGVALTASYADAHRLEDQLAGRGFRRDLADPRHAHRWISPSGGPFDLAFAGEHLSATGNRWDEVAIATAVVANLGDLTLRHASAPAFLALKWAAYYDRGAGDPLASRDLEDLLAVLASRPTIADEVATTPVDLRGYLGEQARTFLASPDAEDLLAAHLNNAQDPAQTIAAVRQLLQRLTHE
jgi:hypothetical protein